MGISKVENREKALQNYLDHALNFSLNMVDFAAIYNIYSIAAKVDNSMGEIRDRCQLILLHSCSNIVSDYELSGDNDGLADAHENDYKDNHRMILEAIERVRQYFETVRLITGEKNTGFVCYSEKYICLSGDISDGVLSLTSEVYGDDTHPDSERHYMFTKEATEKLFSVVTLHEFIEICKKGHVSGMEHFLDKHKIPYFGMTI